MNNKSYKCKINTGYATNGSCTENAYAKSTIRLEKDNMISLGSGDFDRQYIKYTNIKKSIFNITLAFFCLFFLVSLGFNLIFYSLATQDFASLIAPRILLSIFLIVGVIPIIVNLKTINRKIKIDFDSSNFSRVIFNSKADRDSFLKELKLSVSDMNNNSSNEFFADVSYHDVSLNNAKLSILSKNCVGIKTEEINDELHFNSKNRGTIWFLYIFFGIFLSLPIGLISFSLSNGTFEKGMLATLLFGFVGLVGMFVPSLLSRHNLYLYCDDKDVLLKFYDSKARNHFAKELNKAQKYRNRIIKGGVETYQIDYLNKYEILDENPKLRDYGVTIVILTISLFLLSGAIAFLVTDFQLIGSIVMLAMSALFFALAMFVSKSNITIIRSRLKRKKAIKNGQIIIGEIVSCATKLFAFNKSIVYDAELIISYVNEYGKTLTKSIHRKFSKDMQFVVGQKVYICGYFGLYLAIRCSLLNQTRLDEKINAENHALYLASLQNEGEFDVKLKAQKPRSIKVDDAVVPFEKSLRFRDFFTVIMLLPFLSLIVFIGVSVITHNPDDQTQITLAIIFLVIFGGVLGSLTIFSLVNLLTRFRRNRYIKEFIKRANVTSGYITDIDKYVWYVRSGNNGRVAKVRYLINYKYKNSSNQIIQKSFKQSDYLYFSNSYIIGEKIIVFYDNKDSMPMKRST